MTLQRKNMFFGRMGRPFYLIKLLVSRFSSELRFIRSHGACWYGSATDSPEKYSSGGPFQELH